MEKPTLPKGTRDFGPAVMAKRQFIFNTIRGVFQKFGFQPLETPSMENLSTLTGKYGEEGDQLLFKILNSGDYLKDVDSQKLETRNSKLLTSDISEKGLRYDLTVPFARYVVMNRGEISFPFKRYQIQPVWRADRPQKGRYREFYQCDADVVGTDSLICEAEIILMIKDVFNILGIEDFTIKVNHRSILHGLWVGLGSIGHESSLYVALDKLDKIGEDKVKEELQSKGYSVQNLNDLFRFLNSDQDSSSFNDQSRLEIDKGRSAIAEVFGYVSNIYDDILTNNLKLDLSLARGLSYYTGCIFEVKINNVSIGSVSGGGRYDNLTGVFGLQGVSGVGFSFGVDRLYDAMEELKLFPKETQISSKVMIACLDQNSMTEGLVVAQKLRQNNISTEIYPDSGKLKKQLDYANKKMIPFTIVIGSEEMDSGLLAFKDMEKGEQEKLSVDQIISKLKSH